MNVSRKKDLKFSGSFFAFQPFAFGQRLSIDSMSDLAEYWLCATKACITVCV